MPQGFQLLRRLPNWMIGGVVGATLAAIIVLALPRRYESTASFTPAEATQSSIASVAQSLGLDAGTDPTQSPDFYSDLLTTDEIIGRVLSQPFPPQDQSGGGRLIIDEYARPSSDTLYRLDKAMRKLRSLVTVTSSRRTGIVKLTVDASTRPRAQFVAAVFLSEVDRYNQMVRRRKATADRQFVEGRLAAAQDDLHLREDSLQVFLERNRNTDNSPALKLDNDRLTRDVLLEQSIVTSLAQSYEQARIDEVRDTPEISVVQPPVYPRLPASRNGLLYTLLGLMLGGLAGLLWGVEGRARMTGWRRELFNVDGAG